MSIQEEIFQWVKELDSWEQELFLRASISPELSASDIAEVIAMLLGDATRGKGPREVTRDDLPGAKGGEEVMAIRSISGLANVNALANGEELHFKPEGLNVVYGKNGAGKTGYSRILKHAGRTLHPETVLANVSEDSDSKPSATVVVSVGGKEEPVFLDLDALPPALLGRICVADSKAGEIYLTSQTEVDYIPITLTSLQRFSKGLKGLEAELRARQDVLWQKSLDLRPFGQTKVVEVLGGVSHSTSDATIEALAELDAKEEEEYQRLRRAQGEIDARQGSTLREAAEREAEGAERLSTALASIEEHLNSTRVKGARALAESLDGSRQATKLAAERLEEMPLAGVGSDPWRILWESAREFAKHIGEELPPDHDPAHCPFCMQELAPDARRRIESFEEFVAGDMSARLREAERAVEEGRKALPDLKLFRATHGEAIDRLGTDSGEPGRDVLDWLDRAEDAATRLRVGRLEGLEGVDAPPTARVDTWAAERRRVAREHADIERSEDQVRVRLDLDELEARRELGRRLDEVRDYIGALREIERLEQARGKTGTVRVSNKMRELSRDLVEADLQGALNDQLRALNFAGLAVETKLKTVAGTPMVVLRFKSVDDIPLIGILSQGEQRRLALAMFLAEMEIFADASPIVFDDPVTSVDQEGRRHIARTLARLAVERQVIVFTHELSFIRELERQAPSGLPIHAQQVRRIRKTVGHVDPDLPWEGLRGKQRVGPLFEKLRALRALYDEDDEERYKAAVIEFCTLLRGSFERVVEDEVLAEVVTRREEGVRTTNLRKVVCTEEICTLVDRGTDENSAWVHDQAMADGADPPTPDELREGLDIFDELLRTIRDERRRRPQDPARLAAVGSSVEAGAESRQTA